MKKSIYILLALAVLALQSCYKDDEKLFSESSSARMAASLEKTREVLTSSENGWVFEMYPEETQGYGGWAFTAKFDKEDNVTVSCELDYPTNTATSLYKLTNDCGPVLTFDSYNKYIHYFSTPSESAYQGFKGEFEFMVMDVQADVIKLKGKKTGNVMYMYRLNEPAADYLTKVEKMNDDLILAGATGTVGGKNVDATIDLDYRSLLFKADGETVDEVAYCLTGDGLRLFKDVKIGDVTLRDFKVEFDEFGTTKKFVSVADPSVTLDARFPEGWQPISMFAGDFSMVYCKSSSDFTLLQSDVTVTPDPDGTSLWISGLNDHYDIKMTYSKALGVGGITSQLLYEKDHKTLLRVEVSGKKYYVGLVPFAMPKGQTSGYVGYSTSYGFSVKYDTSASDTRFAITDNGKWSGKKSTCPRLYFFTGTTMSSTTRNTTSIPAEYRFFKSSSMIYFPEALIKK